MAQILQSWIRNSIVIRVIFRPLDDFRSLSKIAGVANVPSPNSESSSESLSDLKTTKIKKQRAVKSQDLLNYINSQDPSQEESDNLTKLQSGFVKIIPKRYAKIVAKVPDSAYIVDKDVAAQIATLIQGEKLDNNTPVLEINPGPGVLTKKLKSVGLKNITCFEEDTSLGESLSNLDVKVVPTNFLTFARLHHLDKMEGGSRVSNFLDEIQVDKNIKNGNKNLFVIGTIPNLNFISFTIKTLVTQRVLYEEEFQWQNPIYFVALGSKAHWVLTSTPNSGFFSYRPTTILFQLLFETEYLQELPRNAFIPWQKVATNKSVKFRLKNDFNPNVMHFLKIQTRKSTIEQLGKEHLVPFWFFVRHHLFSRKRQVIAHLEQWIPGCGPRLIRQGFSIYTQFGELTPPQILNVYLQFISWPEFASCSYLAAVEKYSARTETTDEEVFDFQK